MRSSLPFTATVAVLSCSPVFAADFVQLNLTSYFNAKAAATSAANANFDGSGRAYPAELLPTATSFNYSGLEFILPPFHDASANDAIKASGQTINIPEPQLFQSFNTLAISFPGVDAGNLTVNFDDGSSTEVSIIIAPWYSQGSIFDGPIWVPWHYANPSLDSNLTRDYNRTHIQYATVSLPSDKNITSIGLPSSDAQQAYFAITLVPAVAEDSAPALSIQNVRSTTKWANEGATGDDRIQVTINNLARLNASVDAWIASNMSVSLSSSSLTTVTPGTFVRLRPNDQIVVNVGVQNAAGTTAGSSSTATVTISDSNGTSIAVARASDPWPITAGIPEWTNTDSSLMTHESPEWFDDAKFGIFVHWGVFSVPAWAPSGEQYAEWYDWWLHNPPNNSSAIWEHQLETYGPEVVYDDFIANFTADGWNPDNWVDLFVNAGAKYFVLVTKHHDGFALFDTKNTSDRNSLLLGPKRDAIAEVMASAKERAPELRRGTYFSLPEWFNPDYGPYGHGQWPGHPALNWYNGSCCEPFIGRIPVENYITDLQGPQMEILFSDQRYETDILWCDIGYASAFPSIGGDWYNYAAGQGRQVTRNDRCGANMTDFVTPEYATYPATLSQKWETTEGLDPFSFGYNSDTPPSGYQTAEGLIPKFIDIVSKGGNYLLDIGPTANGSVVPEMTQPLLAMGTWLKASGAAIYGTRPWWIANADQSDGHTNVRFTTSPDAFYIIALTEPSDGALTTPAPVPILANDTVTMLGGTGKALNWTVDDGVLSIEVDSDELSKVQYAWAFQVAYSQ
ncbi:glycoside hydrolase family 29 protein [Peniophora sp. CONT]|nr:glycoside hydrolase family 29 protein [Peniophora sp. CONT]